MLFLKLFGGHIGVFLKHTIKSGIVTETAFIKNIHCIFAYKQQIFCHHNATHIYINGYCKTCFAFKRRLIYALFKNICSAISSIFKLCEILFNVVLDFFDMLVFRGSVVYKKFFLKNFTKLHDKLCGICGNHKISIICWICRVMFNAFENISRLYLLNISDGILLFVRIFGHLKCLKYEDSLMKQSCCVSAKTDDDKRCFSEK